VYSTAHWSEFIHYGLSMYVRWQSRKRRRSAYGPSNQSGAIRIVHQRYYFGKRPRLPLVGAVGAFLLAEQACLLSFA
jgi:hypothetical protein